MPLITSKELHITQVPVGGKFRFVNGKFYYRVIKQLPAYVVIGHPKTEKTWNIPNEKIVIVPA